MPGGAWRAALKCIHAGLEVIPAIPGDLFVRLRNLLRPLLQNMEEYEEIIRPPGEDSRQLTPVMAAQLAQLQARDPTIRAGLGFKYEAVAMPAVVLGSELRNTEG